MHQNELHYIIFFFTPIWGFQGINSLKVLHRLPSRDLDLQCPFLELDLLFLEE